MTRRIDQVRADANVVRRERVLRWLTRVTKDAAERAERTMEARALGRAAVLAELVDDFANGRER